MLTPPESSVNRESWVTNVPRESARQPPTFGPVIAGKRVVRTGRAQQGSGGATRRDRATVGWFWRALAAVIVAARYLILLAWIGAAASVTLYLPPLNASSGVGGLIPSGAPALRAAYVNTPGERFGGAGCPGMLRGPAVQWIDTVNAGEPAGHAAMPVWVVRGLRHQLVPGRAIPGLMEPGVMS